MGFFRFRQVRGVPAGYRVYAVGDIHGRADLLRRLLDNIVKDKARSASRAVLVFLGDYIDRGLDSRGVIERLLSPPSGFDVHFLRGNHDQTLLDFLADPRIFRQWREFGASETFLSYRVLPPRFNDDASLIKARDDLAAALPPRHLDFLRRLKLSLTIGDYFFAHAGARPGLPLNEQSAQDLLWIRDEFLYSSADFGATIVHGHTPSNQPVRKANRIGIDTGAYITGQLTAAVLEGTTCRFLTT
jgi:serine/threonine protein phosphatase 1